MFIHSFRLGPLQTNCYVVSYQGRAIIIDPGDEPDAPLAYVERFGMRVERIFLTHLHHDHMGGVAASVRATGADVWANAADDFLREANVRAGQEDFSFNRGQAGMMQVIGLPCMALHTPGHTPGSMSFFFPEAEVVFTGDLIFRNGIGRTDAPYGDEAMLYESIRKRIFILPDATEIHPGHGPETTVEEEKERVYFRL
jgi:glyoxylase-like metal-dependent hydrolase (beta-lactamase superfamily II)